MIQVFDYGLPLLGCEFLGSKDNFLLVGNTTFTPHSPTNKKFSNGMRSMSPHSSSGKRSGSNSPMAIDSSINSPSPTRSKSGKLSIRFDLTPNTSTKEENSSKGVISMSSKIQSGNHRGILPSPISTTSQPSSSQKHHSFSDKYGDRSKDNTQGMISVVFHEHLNGVDGKKIFQEKSRLSCTHWRKGLEKKEIPDSPTTTLSDQDSPTGYEECPFFINDFVSFGLPSHQKSYFIAVGGNNQNEGVTNAYEMRSMEPSAFLVPTKDFECLNAPRSNDSSCNGLNPDVIDGVLTSVDYCLQNNLIAVASEAGNIFVYDTEVMKQVQSFVADDYGLSFVRFTMNGLLGSCGFDMEEPAKIFDLRDPSCGYRCALSLRQKQQSPQLVVSSSKKFTQKGRNAFSPRSTLNSQQSAATNFSLKSPALSCFKAHPCEEKFLLGNTAGVVGFWDLRVDSSVEFPMHHSIVTDIAVHSTDTDVLISCGKDGFISMMNSRFSIPDKTIIFHDASIFTSLSVDFESTTMVITSEEGKVWSTTLPAVPPSSPIFSSI